ncbi:MAG: cytochrome c [Gammaproteobacteria bacterium]|nr:cytochrome c [Gammaproteobacteria bacterium]
MKTYLSKAILVGVLASGFSLNAMALDGGALYKNPAKGGCLACHGAEGKKPLMPTYPKLAGQNAGYIEQQMKDIKSGKRNNGMTAAMKGIMHMVNEEEIKAIADYLSKVK